MVDWHKRRETVPSRRRSVHRRRPWSFPAGNAGYSPWYPPAIRWAITQKAVPVLAVPANPNVWPDRLRETPGEQARWSALQAAAGAGKSPHYAPESDALAGSAVATREDSHR